MNIKNFLIFFSLVCIFPRFVRADEQKQCVPCNLPTPMCGVCEGEKLYLVTFRNATTVPSSNFQIGIKFSDDPDPADVINASVGLPMASLVCAPEDVAVLLQITFIGQPDMQPVVATLNGCDIFTLSYDEGSTDIIVQQNSVALEPQGPPTNPTHAKTPTSECRGLTPNCCSLVACGNGSISEGIVTCDLQCVNATCPTVIACAQGLIDNAEIICFSDYETSDQSVRKARAMSAHQVIASLGKIAKIQPLALHIPELGHENSYSYVPTVGVNAGKTIVLTIAHDSIAIKQNTAQIIKLYQQVSGSSKQFLASFPFRVGATELVHLLSNAEFNIGPDGLIVIQYKQPKPRTLNIVQALTTGKKPGKKPFTKKIFKSLSKSQQENVLKPLALPETTAAQLNAISTASPGVRIGSFASKEKKTL